MQPSVTLSYAQTLDGRLATATRSSQWIGGPESLVFAHRLRASHAAIMVGVGTILQDNPRLTVRHVSGRDPLRVVVDSSLRTPPEALVVAGGAARGTLLATTAAAPASRRAALEALGTTILTLPACKGRVDLQALLIALGERGVTSVMVEGGATLITTLLHKRLAGRLAVCIAPKILGAGIEAVGELGIRDLGQSLSLAELSVEHCGADLIIEGKIVYPTIADGQ